MNTLRIARSVGGEIGRGRGSIRATMLATMSLFALSGSLSGQVTRTEEQRLNASDGAAGDVFGTSVAVSGDLAVVGAIGADAAGTDSGAAYVYRFDGAHWSQQQKLTASDAAAGDRFGTVAISGLVIVVGAPGHDDRGGDSGSAYVFRHNGTTWVEEQKLEASDGVAGDQFGSAVAVSGSVVVVGANANSSNGSVYVFRFDGTKWNQEAKLRASDGDPGDAFGFSVGASGDTAVIGAFGDDDAAVQAGSAYVFRFDGTNWNQEAKLLASDAAAGDVFGYSVSIDGNAVVVGAFGDDDLGFTSGSAYVFRRSGTTWSQEQKLEASDGASGDSFGRSVAVSGNAVVVGSPGDADQGALTGSAYVFRRVGSAWVQEEKLIASDQAPGDQLGTSVAVSGGVALAGANGDDDVGSNSGSAYVFRFTDLALGANDLSLDAGETLTLTTCGGLNGALAAIFLMDVNGSPSLTPLAFGGFDALGSFASSNTCPPGISGLVVDVQAFGFVAPRRIGASNRLTVSCN